jgi:MFS family permease
MNNQLALSTFAVSFSSSSYSGGLFSTEHDLHISEEVAVLGISLLGFGIGPLVMAPLGEVCRSNNTSEIRTTIIKP